MTSSLVIQGHSRMMKHPTVLSSLKRKWFLLLYALMFAKMRCDDQPPPGTPGAGLLCISDCGTCPVICSPPSPSVNSKPPPSSPPQPLPTPPTPPVHHYSPPQPYYFNAPPPSSSLPKPLPPESSPPPPSPPSYISWGKAGPPPPFNYFGGGGNIPSVQAPPGMVPVNYSYPYYYFYASQASSFTMQGSSLFALLLSIHVLYFLYWIQL